MTQHISKEQAEELFIGYATYVYHVAFLLTRSATLADDVTQETFLQIFKSFHNYDLARPLEPWIYRITINTARNLMRKHKWLSFVGFAPDVVLENNVESTIIQNAEYEELWNEINRLPHSSREIIILHFYAGLKLIEIAESLQIPLGTCKSRMHKAIMLLRKQLPANTMFQLSNRGDVL